MRAKQDELVAANRSLSAKNEALEKKVADLEQYSRLNNVEIKGVPVTQNEDCFSIVKTIGNAIGFPVSPSDLDVVHRVATKSKEKNIIARFCCREKKGEFVRRARKARLRTGQIGFSGSTDAAVFVNDHLTFENKRLARRSADDFFAGGAERHSTAAMAATYMQVEDLDEEVG
ncbi:hypothetical protein HPB49_018818 [Dermacentor silvarum]|uniref:Uncharacterized protein n=1 Tax=Dermacentor silvarum TaxID=543639 RepID=A0ACB8C571_DERSI|nr:hypothetical protein HPB49_018818 [Dermacentor silvarum]